MSEAWFQIGHAEREKQRPRAFGPMDSVRGVARAAPHAASSSTRRREAHFYLGRVLGIVRKDFKAFKLDPARRSGSTRYARAPIFRLGYLLMNRGEACRRRGEHPRRRSGSTRCFVSHRNLGRLLKKLGKDSDAEACYREAIWLEPKYTLAHVNLGVVLKELGKAAAAEASFRADPARPEVRGRPSRSRRLVHEAREGRRRRAVLPRGDPVRPEACDRPTQPRRRVEEAREVRRR